MADIKHVLLKDVKTGNILYPETGLKKLSDFENDMGFITGDGANDGKITIQQNGVEVDSFTLNQEEDKTINLTVPTKASDVNALADTTKYGASIDLSIDPDTFIITAQLKDQDGTALGTAKTIDLPLETMVVDGEYDEDAKTIILTLQNGNTVDFSVADLVNGLQSEITADNKLSADLIENGDVNKVVTQTEKDVWNAKQDEIEDLETIRSNAAAGKSAAETIATYGDIVNYDLEDVLGGVDLSNVALLNGQNQNFTGLNTFMDYGVQWSSGHSGFCGSITPIQGVAPQAKVGGILQIIGKPGTGGHVWLADSFTGIGVGNPSFDADIAIDNDKIKFNKPIILPDGTEMELVETYANAGALAYAAITEFGDSVLHHAEEFLSLQTGGKFLKGWIGTLAEYDNGRKNGSIDDFTLCFVTDD